MTHIVDVEVNDIQLLKSIVEILDGLVSEANADFIKDIDAYSNMKKKQIDQQEVTNESIVEKKKRPKKKPQKRGQTGDNDDSKKTTKASEHDSESDIELAYDRDKNPGALKIITHDSNQVLISSVVLKAPDFKNFYVGPDEYTVGLNIDELFKYIKNVDKDGVMCIRIDADDLQNMMFSVASVQTSKTSKCGLKLLNLKDRKKKCVEIEFSMVLRISSADFHKTCKDLSQFSSHIEIICDPEKFTIICTGEMSTHSRIFENEVNDGVEGGVKITTKQDSTKKTAPDIIRLIFELKYINLMYKCMNLSKDMEIYLKAGSVMFLKYKIGKCSEMLVGIAPTTIKNKAQNMNYDGNAEQYYDDDPIIPV